MSGLAQEPEFEQAYKELASTLENSTLFTKFPAYRTALKVVSIPERVVQFRVAWENDKGEVRRNKKKKKKKGQSLSDPSPLLPSPEAYLYLCHMNRLK